MKRRAGASTAVATRHPRNAFCPRCGGVYPVDFKGEWLETDTRCSDCGVAVDPPPFLVPSGDEARYTLLGWAVADRIAITDHLAEAGIPYRFDEGLILAVQRTSERPVDRVVADLAEAGAGTVDTEPTELGPDGGEEAVAAAEELFLAAKRLHRAPTDARWIADLLTAADAVDDCLAPYAVSAADWGRVQNLTSEVGHGHRQRR